MFGLQGGRHMKTLILSFLTLCWITTYGQSIFLEQQKFGNKLDKQLKVDLLKDSDALYTINIQIVVDRRYSYKPIITSNNPTLFNKLKGLTFLQDYDYRPMMGNTERVKFIVPVGIIILGSKYGPKNIDIHIMDKLSDIFYHQKEEDENTLIMYLPCYVISDDRKVYH